jgi:hypothetical protein
VLNREVKGEGRSAIVNSDLLKQPRLPLLVVYLLSSQKAVGVRCLLLSIIKQP